MFNKAHGHIIISVTFLQASEEDTVEANNERHLRRRWWIEARTQPQQPDLQIRNNLGLTQLSYLKSKLDAWSLEALRGIMESQACALT